MKICFISEAKTIHTQRWLQGIAASGQEVDLISSSFAHMEGIRLHQTELYHPNPIRTLYNCRKVRKLLVRMQPDITHLFGLYSVGSLALLPILYKIPNLVVTPWGTDVVYDFSGRESFKSKFIKRFLLKQADCITSLSHFMTKQIRNYLKDCRNVYYVPWGADLDVFRNGNNQYNSAQFTIGITKALTKKYGHVHLLEAVSILVHQFCEKNLKLIIVGRGELEAEIKRKCQDLEISDYVVFKDFTSDRKKLHEYLSTFSVYVMPSVCKSETLGVAAIEASAMGIPIIASNIGGIPEVVKNYVTGFLTEPGDSQAIANALMLFISNKELRYQMGRAARQWIEKKFSFSDSVAKMINCYEKLLANR